LQNCGNKTLYLSTPLKWLKDLLKKHGFENTTLRGIKAGIIK
jgi:hypothetical protein